MQSLSRGQRLKLENLTAERYLTVSMGGRMVGATLDFSCFGLDTNGKLADEANFVFYNQKRSPCGAIIMVDPKPGCLQNFTLDLHLVPDSIERLVFVMTIDGSGEMGNLEEGIWNLSGRAGPVLASYHPCAC